MLTTRTSVAVRMSGEKTRLLPPLLPLLVVEEQVLLPGTPMTLRVKQQNKSVMNFRYDLDDGCLLSPL